MRLLLDAHLSPAIARQLAANHVDATALQDWHDGNYRHAADDQILLAAAAEGLVLVTFDARSIQPLLKEWVESGRHHAGVVVVNRKTLPQNDIGGMVRALRQFANGPEQPWGDRLVFLQAAATL